MISYAIIVFDETTPFPSLYALIPVIGTGLLILCAVPKTFIHKLLSVKPLVGIGLISYSAYLWHQPLLAFARHRLLGDVSDLILIALCLSSLIMAWFSWKFVEGPFRNKHVVTRNKVFLISMIGIGIFLLLGLSMHFKNGYGKRVSFSEELSRTFERPSIENCFALLFNHSEEQWGCTLGRDEGDIDFILFGDSHSISLSSLVHETGKQKGIKIFYTGAYGCLPFVGIFPKRSDQYSNNCNLLNERVYQFAKDSKVRGIILSARWSYYTIGDYDLGGAQLISNKENGPFTLQHSLDVFPKALDATVKKYASIEVPIHLITQPPHQKYSPESVYFMIAKGRGSIEDLSVKRSNFEKLNDIPINIFSTYKNEIDIYDITNLFCDEAICPIGEKTRSFYYDSDHLSTHGALKLSNTIESILAK
jgi:hypothetical protein